MSQVDQPVDRISAHVIELISTYEKLSLCFLFSCFGLLVAYTSSRDSLVGTALGYGLDDRGSRVRFPAGAGNFSLYHCVKNGSESHPASYPMSIRGSFPGGKAAGA
jgi:hypothetical protein